MFRIIICFGVLLFISFVGSKSLPSYIKPCRKLDPNLRECATKSAQAALADLIKGDRAYKIPKFDPFFVPLIDTDGIGGLKFQLHNMSLQGLSMAQIQDVNFELDKQKVSLRIYIPSTSVDAKYIVNGKLFSFNLAGEGPANIKFNNATVYYTLEYSLITKKDGKKYIDTDSIKSDLKITHTTRYYFGNLFGDNKALDDSFNEVLNENSKEVDNISAAADHSLINSIVSTVLNALFRAVPYDEIFID